MILLDVQDRSGAAEDDDVQISVESTELNNSLKSQQK